MGEIFKPYTKMSFRDTLNNGKLTGVCDLNVKRSILNDSLTVHFCLDKYSIGYYFLATLSIKIRLSLIEDIVFMFGTNSSMSLL